MVSVKQAFGLTRYFQRHLRIYIQNRFVAGTFEAREIEAGKYVT
jgi:hypothetical protein